MHQSRGQWKHIRGVYGGRKTRTGALVGCTFESSFQARNTRRSLRLLPGGRFDPLGCCRTQTAPSRQLGIKMSYQGSNGIFLLLWCHGNDNGC